MEKPMPSDGSSKKANINMVKVGGEDLYHVDEELSPIAAEVGEEEWEEEEDDDSDLLETNGPECLGNMEPEGPEEWIS